MKPERLFHFTCADHGYRAIGKRGVLRPNWHPFLQANLLWLTTEAAPDRESTGLGMSIARCDRMAYRYIVTDLDDCQPWIGSGWRSQAPRHAVADLEAFGDPEHWWVSSSPVVARLG